MNKLKTTFNGNKLCIFAVVDKDIVVHLGTIDTTTNRIYTTELAYNLMLTKSFKSTHPCKMFNTDEVDEEFKLSCSDGKKPAYIKFDACVNFAPRELVSIIKMCNSELIF